MKHTGVDALIIGSPELIRYLTGFTGSESLFILGKTEGRLFVDSDTPSRRAANAGRCQRLNVRRKPTELCGI
jgi:Xaa-Pro aminopeptidase